MRRLRTAYFAAGGPLTIEQTSSIQIAGQPRDVGSRDQAHDSGCVS